MLLSWGLKMISDSEPCLIYPLNIVEARIKKVLNYDVCVI